MKRTSAIAVAAGLAGSLISGLIGYSMRLSGLRQTRSEPSPVATEKPIVKTITTTVRIHKKPKTRPPAVSAAAPAPVQYISAPAPVAAPPVTKTSGSHAGGDDGNDHEGGGDD